MEGKFVKWKTANGVADGLVIKPAGVGVGNWVVALKNGKFVIVNESSFING
jgi:hypothetical protein